MMKSTAGFASAVVLDEKLRTACDGDHKALGLRRCITLAQAVEWGRFADDVLGERRAS